MYAGLIHGRNLDESFTKYKCESVQLSARTERVFRYWHDEELGALERSAPHFAQGH
jgi:hypothetical protein